MNQREESQVSEKLAVVDPLSSTFSSNGVECIDIFGKGVIYDEHCSRGRLSDSVNRFVARKSLIEVYRRKQEIILDLVDRIFGWGGGKRKKGGNLGHISREERVKTSNAEDVCFLLLNQASKLSKLTIILSYTSKRISGLRVEQFSCRPIVSIEPRDLRDFKSS